MTGLPAYADLGTSSMPRNLFVADVHLRIPELRSLVKGAVLAEIAHEFERDPSTAHTSFPESGAGHGYRQSAKQATVVGVRKARTWKVIARSHSDG